MKQLIRILLVVYLSCLTEYSYSQIQEAWVRGGLGFISPSSENPGLVLDGNGNVIAGVNSEDFGPGDQPGFVKIFTLTKYSSSGTLVFDIQEPAQTYNKELVDMAVDIAGNIYCAVQEWDVIDGSVLTGLFAVYKYSPSGGVLWKRSYGDGQYSSANALAVDAAGNVYLTGSCRVSGAQLTGTLPDYLTVKWNAAGERQWAVRYDGASPGEGSNIATDIIVDGSGNVYITGHSQLNGLLNYATIKYNSAGTEVWVQRYNGLASGDDRASAITRDVAGFIYVTGSSEGAMATVKYNNDGAQIWVVREGSSGAEGRAIKVDQFSNVYVAGNSSSSLMALVKYNFAGTKQWLATKSGSGRCLQLDARGNAYISGTVTGDGAMVKYNSSGVQQWMQTHNSPLATGVINPLVISSLESVYVIRFASFNRDGNANAYYAPDLVKYTQCDLVCPADMTINTSPGECTGVVNYTVGITGECGSNIAYSQPTGTALPVGTTIVAVVDLVSGEHCSFNVTVRDAEAPQARCNNITLALDATGNATLSAAQIDNKSSDNCGIQAISISKTSFTCADIGPNTVTLTVTDVNGNTNSCNATVTVQDNTPPTALCKNATVYLNASGNGSITTADIDNGSTDACGAVTLSLSRTSFTCADKGTRSVTLTVTDPNGNTATCSANVTVIDNIPPSISSVTADPSYLWPSDRKMKQVNISAVVSDNCPGVTWAVTGIAVAAGEFPNDNINPDYEISGARRVRLRAEPPFEGIYRAYTVTITATDAANNTSTASVHVTVALNAITQSNPITTGYNIEVTDQKIAGQSFRAKAFPNPSKKNFTIQVAGLQPGKSFAMQVMDMHGRILETKNMIPQSTITLGEAYRPGVYMVRIISGKEIKEIKLLKLSD